jgi:dTDP-4-dehydrorhamnose reductase
MAPDCLVFGGSGFVGSELVSHFHCPGTSFSGREGFVRCDAADRKGVERILDNLRPRFVINSVGLADVDMAETNPGLAARLNEETVKNIVALKKDFRFKFLHISTDYVFDGVKGNYVETDRTNPINVYGITKLAGEQSALEDSDSIIIRISTPFGTGQGSTKKQFFRFVYERLKEGREVNAVSDQFVTSTYLPDLANAAESLFEKDASGIFHVGGPDRLSRYEFACQVAQTACFDSDLVKPVLSGDMRQWKARRPRDTSLSAEKSIAFGIKYTRTADALKELISQGSRG